MPSIHQIHDIYRAFRLKGAARRLQYIVSKKANVFESSNSFSSPEVRPELNCIPLNSAKICLFYDENPSVKTELNKHVAHIMDGSIEGFGDSILKGTWPPSWLVNPKSNAQKSNTSHWSKYTDDSPDDIKWLWQANRFQFAWAIGRHALANKSTEHANAFYSCLKDWAQNNPTNMGPNWMCGQETALRAMAILFCVSSFKSLGFVATEQQATLVKSLLVDSAHRIESTLGYAMSQRNNHAISENVALLLLSFSLLDSPSDSPWLKKAESNLHEAINDQFYSDGAYSQHSFNYQRLATLTLIMALEFYPSQVTSQLQQLLNKAISSSIEFLRPFVNTNDGTLPNLGANDGSLTLPLWASAFSDFRPLIRYEDARHDLRSTIPPGRYDELFHFFDYKKPEQKELELSGVQAIGTRTGYWQSKSKSFDLFLRSPLLLNHRPSQEDFLSIHLRWKNEDIAIDPGTFSYNSPPPWNHGLAQGNAHNTCSPYGDSILKKTGRFLWTHWPTADTKCLVNTKHCQQWQFTLCSKSRSNYKHKRIVAHGDNHVIVFDECTGKHSETALRWNFKALKWHEDLGLNKLTLQRHGLNVTVASNASWSMTSHSGNQTTSDGWQAPWYGLKKPCLSYDFVCKNEGRVRFITIFSDEDQTDLIDRVSYDWLEHGTLNCHELFPHSSQAKGSKGI